MGGGGILVGATNVSEKWPVMSECFAWSFWATALSITLTGHIT